MLLAGCGLGSSEPVWIDRLRALEDGHAVAHLVQGEQHAIVRLGGAGEVLWRRPLGSPQVELGGFEASEDVVAVQLRQAQKQTVVALDASSGDVLWRGPTRQFGGSPTLPLAVINAGPLDLVVTDDVVLDVFHDGTDHAIHALHPSDGRELWRHSFGKGASPGKPRVVTVGERPHLLFRQGLADWKLLDLETGLVAAEATLGGAACVIGERLVGAHAGARVTLEMRTGQVTRAENPAPDEGEVVACGARNGRTVFTRDGRQQTIVSSVGDELGWTVPLEGFASLADPVGDYATAAGPLAGELGRYGVLVGKGLDETRHVSILDLDEGRLKLSAPAPEAYGSVHAFHVGGVAYLSGGDHLVAIDEATGDVLATVYVDVAPVIGPEHVRAGRVWLPSFRDAPGDPGVTVLDARTLREIVRTPNGPSVRKLPAWP